jgi:hypothetical protein
MENEMRTDFNTYKEFKTAVEARGLVIFQYPPSHEGMHESDMYEMTSAGKYEDPTDRESELHFGYFCNNEDGTVTGFLYDTFEEFLAWYNELIHLPWEEIDDPMGDHHGCNL